ncbi:MAG TPA: hypothetical protein PLH94_13175 [Fimbriimonadaceae bacterium]|nr:hypothetical protein [Fimbriimonadaceae bacterium]
MFLLLAALTLEPATLAIASMRTDRDPQSGGTPLTVVVRNIGTQPIRLWTPNSVEGMRCVKVWLEAKGKKPVEFKPTIPPRAAGVPTAVPLAPKGKLQLAPIDLAECVEAGFAPGRYRLWVEYVNQVAEDGPAKGVWTGSIRSRTISVQIGARN